MPTDRRGFSLSRPRTNNWSGSSPRRLACATHACRASDSPVVSVVGVITKSLSTSKTNSPTALAMPLLAQTVVCGHTRRQIYVHAAAEKQDLVGKNGTFVANQQQALLVATLKRPQTIVTKRSRSLLTVPYARPPGRSFGLLRRHPVSVTCALKTTASMTAENKSSLGKARRCDVRRRPSRRRFAVPRRQRARRRVEPRGSGSETSRRSC